MGDEVEESPDDAVGTAFYFEGDDDRIAAYRAARIRRSRWYDSWPTRLPIAVIGHFLVLMAVSAPIDWYRGHRLKDGRPMSFATVVIFGAGGVIGAWLLYARIYGYRHRLMTRVLDRPPAPPPRMYTFTDHDVAIQIPEGGRRVGWEDIAEVVGFPDGFLLVYSQTQVEWLPRRAFHPPFDPVDAMVYLGAMVPKYVEINRPAGLTPRSWSGPGAAESVAPSTPTPPRRFAVDREVRPPAGPVVAASGPSDALGSAVVHFDEPECRASWTAHRELIEVPRRWTRFRKAAVLATVGQFKVAWDFRPPDPIGALVFLACQPILVGMVLLIVWRIWFAPRGDPASWEEWYAEFPLRGQTVTYRFYPSHLSRDHRSGRADLPWESVGQVVESADGFYLVSMMGSEWIPKHALQGPFHPQDLARLLRSKAASYRIDDRRVGRTLDPFA